MMEIEDEVLPQFYVHTIDEIPAKAFMRRLAEGDVYQNWKMSLSLLRSKNNCLIMSIKVFKLTIFF
jgi:hypothetical protein